MTEEALTVLEDAIGAWAGAELAQLMVDGNPDQLEAIRAQSEAEYRAALENYRMAVFQETTQLAIQYVTRHTRHQGVTFRDPQHAQGYDQAVRDATDALKRMEQHAVRGKASS